jgi:hypothetical protein
MKSWWTVALVSLATVNASEHLLAQGRGLGSNPSRGPSARPAGPSLHVRPRPKPPVPFVPSVNGRFLLPMPVVPAPFTSRRSQFPLRFSWFGLMVFDPSWLWAPSVADETSLPPSAPPLQQQKLAGGLQLDIEPRRALVYVDGWYAGMVEDFSGYYHHLETSAGWHMIEIVAPDYQPLMFDVAVSPGRTTTYRNSLNRAPSRY